MSLRTLPPQTDFIIEKKSGNIKNVIGKIFRQYNVVEYKSPEDQLNIETYYKLLTYGILYMLQKHKEGVWRNQITLTLIRDIRPYKLFKQLKEEDLSVYQKYPGVYYLTGNLLFPTQIIVGSELKGKDNIWMKALTQRLNEETAAQLLNARGIINSEYSEAANEILKLAIQKNQDVFKKIKEEGDLDMNLALRELMKDEIEEELSKTRDKAIAEGLAEGQAKGIAKGEAKTKTNTKKALKMILSGGYTAEAIAKETSLDLSYVKDLQEQLRS